MELSRQIRKRVLFIVVSVLLWLAVIYGGVAKAAGPGIGQMMKRDVPVSRSCVADRVTVRWKLDSLLGEPIVNGTFMYEGDCEPSSDFVVWLRVESGPAVGFVRLAPAIPNAPGEWGSNVSGSPSWGSTLCGYHGTRRDDCYTPSTAKRIWKSGTVTDFAGPWGR